DAGLYGWNTFDRALNDGSATDKLLLHALVALLQQPIDRRHHAYDLLFRHLHPASDCIAVRIVIQRGEFDQIFPSQEQPCVLRAANSFATGKTYKVETHSGVLPQVLNWRHIRGGVQVTRPSMFMRNGDPIFASDFATLRRIEEVRHHGAVAKSRAVI